METDDWTPQIGLVRGVCTGSVVAVTIGAVLVGVAWWFGPHGSFFSDFFWARLGTVLVPIGFAFAWGVSRICEWAGGLSSIVFLMLAGSYTVLLGVALTVVSLTMTNWSGGAAPRVLTASAWVALPTAIGGWAACAIRWYLRRW